MKITVFLPKHREAQGVLILQDSDNQVVHSCACLGKSDNTTAKKTGNETRNPLRPYGDVPSGKYLAHLIGTGDPKKFGPCARILLAQGVSGDAAIALGPRDKDGNGGRWTLEQHGGPLLTNGNLRPTLGCVRVADEDQAFITSRLGDQTTFDYEIVQLAL